MATRRTFLKGVGIALGAAVVPARWTSAEPGSQRGTKSEEEKGDDKRRRGSVAVFLNDFGRNPLTVCALVISDVAPLRHALRRTKRHRLPARERRTAEIRAEQASKPFKTYLYRQLADIEHVDGQGFSVVAAHVRNSDRWSGNEFDLYFRVLTRVLHAAQLPRFDDAFVYANSRRPGWRQLLTEKLSLPPGVEVFPVNPRDHEGLQVAQFVAYGLHQQHHGRRDKAFDHLRRHLRADLDLTDGL